MHDYSTMTDDDLSALVAERVMNHELDFATDRNAIAEMELLLERQGLHNQYVRNLYRLVSGHYPHGMLSTSAMWLIRTASPRLCCEAAVAAKEDE